MKKRELLFLLLIGLVVETWAYWYQSTHLQKFAVDWQWIFRPAARMLLQGGNPYEVGGFHNPIWVLPILAPFALLGDTVGTAVWFLFSALLFAYVAWRLGGSLIGSLAFLLSPLVTVCLYTANIEALVFLGLILPPPVGLFFVLLKPQMGIAIAAYWAYTILREHGWARLARTFAPVILALAANLLIYGRGLLELGQMRFLQWNASLFPWSVPFGLAILAVAAWKRRADIAAAASPMLSPYLSIGSWSIVQLSFLRNDAISVASTLLLWIAILYSKAVGTGL